MNVNRDRGSPQGNHGSPVVKESALHDLSRHLDLLSEPVRVRLLAALSEEELAVGELVRIVQLPQSTVSRHLKALLVGGWVARRSEGTAGWFRFDATDVPEAALRVWSVVREDFEGTLQHGEDRARLGAVLEARLADSSSFFGRMHAQWDALRAELFGGDFFLPTLLSLLPPELEVADLGCGTGEVLAMLAPVVRRVVGIDREQAMLEAAAERCAGVDNVTLRQGGLEDLPLGDREVDAALLMLVLHHVADPARALREARRVVRPGGTVVVLDMQAHERVDYRHTMGHLHLGFDEERVRSFAAEVGLTLAALRALPPAAEAQGPPLFVAVMRR